MVDVSKLRLGLLTYPSVFLAVLDMTMKGGERYRVCPFHVLNKKAWPGVQHFFKSSQKRKRNGSI